MNFQPKLEVQQDYHPLLNMIQHNNAYILLNYNDFSKFVLPYHIEKYGDLLELLPNHQVDYSERVDEHLKMLLLEQCEYFSGRPFVIRNKSYLLDKVTVYMYGDGYGVGSYEEYSDVYPPKICPFTGEHMYD